MSRSTSKLLTPNSQNHSLLTSQSSQSQRKKAGVNRQKSYFKEVVSEAGVILGDDETPTVITQEQSLVTRDIDKILQSHLLYPGNVDEFMTGLKTMCGSQALMNKALLPTELQKQAIVSDADHSQLKIPQESLIRMLIKVMCLQNEVVEMLLKQITECVADDNEDSMQLRLLLKQLCFLHHINDSRTLSTRLLDIVETARYAAQLEILNLVPEIIPDKDHEEAAKQLSKLLEENEELTGAIIDCLSSLSTSISSEVRSDIQQQILSRLGWASSSKIFPVLFEYLITDCSSKNLHGILVGARAALDTIMESKGNDQEQQSHKVLIFNRLHSLATGRKSLCEGWISVISSVRSSTDQKPIDLLILFMIHSIGDANKSIVEGLIRKRVKTGLFKLAHIETLFEKYLVVQILSDYLNSILRISTRLLQCYNEPTSVEFSSVMCKLLFSHEFTDRLQRQELIYNLMLIRAGRMRRSVTPVLNVLGSFLEDYEKLQQHTVHLMGFLEDLSAFELKDVKLVFELLCSLTCGARADDTMSGLRDEIHMIIRKLLSNSKQVVKHRGIIGAVAMAKTLATAVGEQTEVTIDNNELTIEDLPNDGPQDAANLLMLANTCTLGKPDSIGLYYDQLSSMLATSANLDNHFITWLYQLVTVDFQNIFVTELVPDPINNIPLSMQFSLNSEQEMDSPIAVKIAELSLKSQFFGNSSILTLAPVFRLLRLSHFKLHNGDLSTIDALLGCGVLMPDLDDLEAYNFEQLKQVADCIFHCINWFREIISAFLTQKNKKLRNKVLARLAGVVQLEEILGKCLSIIPDHKLPSSYFDSISQNNKQVPPSKSSKLPRKPPKTPETIVNVDETMASTSATQQKKAATATSKRKPKEIYEERIFCFREMDIDVILLLRYPFKPDNDSDRPISTTSQQATTLDVNQLKFLMKDFVLKLETLSNKNKSSGLSHMSIVNLGDLISDCVRLLPNINRSLTTVIASLQEFLHESDCLDSEPNSIKVKNLKICFYLIIKSYAMILGWSGFQQIKNLNLLKDCLKALRGSNQSQSQLISVKGLTVEFIKTLIGYVEICPDLPSAVSLVEIVQALYVVNSNPEVKKKLTTLSEKLLSKQWYTLNGDIELGKSAEVDVLVKAYLNGTSVKTVCSLVATLQGQSADLKAKDNFLPMLVSITKTNFYIFYRCLCVTLLEAVRTEVFSLTNNQHLVLWRTTALTMQGLMTIVKTQETRTNLTSYLKNSIGILKVFLSSGIPILEIMLRSKPDEVIEVFKIMQTSTRFLHHLCCYSKYTKDKSLVPHVPQFRLLLESLLYRVKAALVANRCSDAFWMGILRNRDLHGEDIASQTSTSDGSTVEGGSDNEELLPDESDDEEVVVNNDENGSSDADEDARMSDAY